ncbi:hypothetical protein PAMP_004805 [Pampus punctatissimus]
MVSRRGLVSVASLILYKAALHVWTRLAACSQGFYTHDKVKRRRGEFTIVRTGSSNAFPIFCSCGEKLPRAADERLRDSDAIHTVYASSPVD